MAAAGPSLFFSPKIAPGPFRCSRKGEVGASVSPSGAPIGSCKNNLFVSGANQAVLGLREKNKGENSVKFDEIFHQIFEMLQNSSKFGEFLKMVKFQKIRDNFRKILTFSKFLKFLRIPKNSRNIFKVFEIFRKFLKIVEIF